MPELTPAALAEIMRACAGEAAGDLHDEILDVEFASLGYDSLALLETTGRIQQAYGVRLDDDVASATTPRTFLALVNEAIASAE
jgi:minimal PKS acyl carrier protein